MSVRRRGFHPKPVVAVVEQKEDLNRPEVKEDIEQNDSEDDDVLEIIEEEVGHNKKKKKGKPYPWKQECLKAQAECARLCGELDGCKIALKAQASHLKDLKDMMLSKK